MSWFKDILYKVRMAGGKLVSKETAQKRLNVCYTLEGGKPCKYAGKVYPLPGIEDDGCTICGCPFKTKPLMETYFDLETMKLEKVTCPHPTGDLWANL